jgi:2-polyprenyl-6-methoxyphenol hydroxylase-like FAD-dependent oxidoreductase
MNRPRALVIGGSLSGLFAANLLRLIGWHVEVFERASGSLSGRGAGLGAQSELFSVMRRIGIPIDDSIWAEVRSHICLDRNGEMVCQVPVRKASTAWDRVYHALRQIFPTEFYRGGMTLSRCEQDEHGVTAVFADGSRATADLLVGADGMRSTVRRQLLPEAVPRYAGYVAWRGVLEESQIPANWRDTALDHMVFCLPDGELAFTVPMAAPDDVRSVRRCMLVWFRPAEYRSTLRDWCTDATGHCHGDSIPPPLIRPALITEFNLAAHALLAPQIAGLVQCIDEPILSAVFDLESPRMTFGRVALVGDAAFVARPHVGTGVTKAALDAQALADALAGSSDNLIGVLADYEHARKQPGRQLVARSRHLGAHLEPPRSGCDEGRRPRPPIETLLREYGTGSITEWPSVRTGRA